MIFLGSYRDLEWTICDAELSIEARGEGVYSKHAFIVQLSFIDNQ